MKIEELDPGTQVKDGFDTMGFITFCPHGRLYYALAEPNDEGEWEKAIRVSDLHEDHLSLCSKCG